MMKPAGFSVSAETPTLPYVSSQAGTGSKFIHDMVRPGGHTGSQTLWVIKSANIASHHCNLETTTPTSTGAPSCPRQGSRPKQMSIPDQVQLSVLLPPPLSCSARGRYIAAKYVPKTPPLPTYDTSNALPRPHTPRAVVAARPHSQTPQAGAGNPRGCLPTHEDAPLALCHPRLTFLPGTMQVPSKPSMHYVVPRGCK